MVRWQDYALLPAKEVLKLPNEGRPTQHLGVLGTTGMTAFFGLYKIGKPFAGDTLVVTGAAGATDRWSARSVRSRVAAWWAWPAARRSAIGWWTSSGSTRPSTTRAPTSPASYARRSPRGSMCVGQRRRIGLQRSSGEAEPQRPRRRLRRHFPLRDGQYAGRPAELFQPHFQARDHERLHRERWANEFPWAASALPTGSRMAGSRTRKMCSRDWRTRPPPCSAVQRGELREAAAEAVK